MRQGTHQRGAIPCPRSQRHRRPLTLREVCRPTVDEYERIASAGALDDDRVVLIEGYLVTKMGKRAPALLGRRIHRGVAEVPAPGRMVRTPRRPGADPR